MNRILNNVFLVTTILALAACNLNNPSGTGTPSVAGTPAGAAIPGIGLAIQAQNGTQPLNAVGQTINYSYTVTNTGTVALTGPVTINSDKGAGSCPGLNTAGNFNTTFDPGEIIFCTGSYLITQADLDAGSITNTATANVGGINSTQTSNVVTLATTANIPSVTSTPETSPSSSYVPGSTIPHTVIKGDWLLQIARCYGADYGALRRANLWIVNPNLIQPNTIVTIPNAGSKGTIYGPPCVKFHTVQTGDTWASIAQAYNADVVVLQAANRGVALTVGKVIKVPVNSVGGSTPPPSQSITTSTSLNVLPTILTSGQSASFTGLVAATPAVPDGQAVKLQVQNGGCGSNPFTDLFQVTTTGGNGSFIGSFTVPSAAGTYGIQATFPQTANIGGNIWQQSSSACQTITVNSPPSQSITTSTSLNVLPATLTSGQTASFTGLVAATPAVPDGQVVKLQVQNGGCGSNPFTDLFQVTTSGGNGSFTGSFTVPAVSGTYGIRASFLQTLNIGGNIWQESSSTCQTITVTPA
jgi:LysM repeat protein